MAGGDELHATADLVGKVLAADDIEDDLVRTQTRSHDKLSRVDVGAVAEPNAGSTPVLDNDSLDLRIGEKAAPQSNENLMCGMTDLLRAAWRKTK